MKNVEVNFKLNGKEITVECEPAKTLLDLIRDDLGLKGVKRGCEIGECGACTVIMNGKTVASCMVLAPQAEGAEITTIEGLSPEGEELHPIQQAFIDKGAIQCGFCTPGMILSAKVLLDNNLSPSREQIRRAIAGNICRCTGYKQIVDAIEYAAGLLNDRG
ncbi:MAG: (2Fe-2S)-binding protein [Elusimicrobiota bacterium]|nr:(2Fe-2S)-binding protein [Elusimicrobiota bacterium]